MKAIQLRDYQARSLDALRDGIRAGLNRQLLMAATGAGKTVCAAQLMESASNKKRRAVFLVDRVSLVDQTSRVFDEYGIAHGVIQANHWRYRPYEYIQVASVQTLSRRGFPEDIDLLVIDEAHTIHKSTINYVLGNPDLRVVGLSATPFTKGLGKVFQNLVNVTTTNRLVEEGFLAPVRYYVAKEIDMTGAKTVAGEWADSEVESRGIRIVGDIVATWVEKTRQHFGRPVKTIAFGATVAHCEEIAAAFQQAGYNFRVVSYRDGNDEGRRALIEEFRKPDSDIIGLISCEALCLDEETEILTREGWRGIDAISESDRVASYEHTTGSIVFEPAKKIIRRHKGISERMVTVESKRLSLRVTEGHRMLVPLGANGASNGRWQFRSARDCVDVAGLDIPVAGFAEPDSIRVAQETGLPIKRRIAANSYVLRKQGMSYEAAKDEALARITSRLQLKFRQPQELTLDECRLIGFWIGDGSTTRPKSGGITYSFSQSMRYANIVEWFDNLIARIGLHAQRYIIPKEKVSKATADVIKWHIPRGTGFGNQSRCGIYGLEPYMKKNGSDLFWGLNKEQFLALIEGFEYADGDHYHAPNRDRHTPRISNTSKELLDTLQAIAVCRGCRATLSVDDERTNKGYKPLYKLTVRADRTFVTSAFGKKSAIEAGKDSERVWCVETQLGTIVTRRCGRVAIMGNCKGFDVPDVLCGIGARPLRKSLSTHIQQIGRVMRIHPDKEYAIWLDHAGNVLRFHEDMEDVFQNGLSGFDSKNLDQRVRKEPTARERELRTCPRCKQYMPPKQYTCLSCGFEMPRKQSGIENVAGEIVELTTKTKGKARNGWMADKDSAWRMIIGEALIRKAPDYLGLGKASPDDIKKAEKFALAQYRSIYGEWPYRAMRNVEPIMPTPEVRKYIKSRCIAFSLRRAA